MSWIEYASLREVKESCTETGVPSAEPPFDTSKLALLRVLKPLRLLKLFRLLRASKILQVRVCVCVRVRACMCVYVHACMQA